MKAPVSIERSALLVIDVQDSFKPGQRWARRSNPRFEDSIRRLIDAYRSKKLPVFFFLDSDDSEHFTPDSPYFKLMNFIQPVKGEPVIIKTSRNCFTTTNLDYLLRQRDVNRVVITGIKTEQCCETTARVASDLGYDVDFVTEATLTFPIPDAEGGDELSTEEVVRRTEYVLRNRFAKIKSVDEIVSELGRKASSTSL